MSDLNLTVVYYKDGSSGHVLPSDFPAIEKALAKLVGEGASAFDENGERDTLLRLTAANGDKLVVLASTLVGASMSTVGGRRRRAETDQRLDAENADLKPVSP